MRADGVATQQFVPGERASFGSLHEPLSVNAVSDSEQGSKCSKHGKSAVSALGMIFVGALIVLLLRDDIWRLTHHGPDGSGSTSDQLQTLI